MTPGMAYGNKVMIFMALSSLGENAAMAKTTGVITSTASATLTVLMKMLRPMAIQKRSEVNIST